MPIFKKILKIASFFLANRKFSVYNQLVVSRCSAVGSVRALGAWGRRFEPCHLDQYRVFGPICETADLVIDLVLPSFLGLNWGKNVSFFKKGSFGLPFLIAL